MKLEEITPDTPLGDIDDAIDRGDFTLEEFGEEFRRRIGPEGRARRVDAPKAIAAVQASETGARPRAGKWTARYIRLGERHDGPAVFLVKCGRAAWHVEPGTFVVRKLGRSAGRAR